MGASFVHRQSNESNSRKSFWLLLEEYWTKNPKILIEFSEFEAILEAKFIIFFLCNYRHVCSYMQINSAGRQNSLSPLIVKTSENYWGNINFTLINSWVQRLNLYKYLKYEKENDVIDVYNSGTMIVNKDWVNQLLYWFTINLSQFVIKMETINYLIDCFFY